LDEAFLPHHNTFLNNNSLSLVFTETHTDTELIDLITELETMKVLGQNTNIINLLGCCSQGGDLLVIMELCEKGNLRDYLRLNRENYFYDGPPPLDAIGPLKEDQEVLTFKDLMSFAFQVARGMEYLAQKKVTIIQI